MAIDLSGTGVALVTPFDRNYQVDYPALRRLVDDMCQPHGVDYLVVLGSTGETATLSAQEKLEVAAAVLEHTAGRKPVVVGAGGNNTTELLGWIRDFDFAGYAAILSSSPHYNKPTQQGIVQHFTQLADAAPVPIILYNVPGRTGSNMAATTTLTLAQHPNIIGIKEASGDLVKCGAIALGMPADFLLISGDDALTLPMMAIGAKGQISVTANSQSMLSASITRHALIGHWAEARQAHERLFSFTQSLFLENNPAGIKAALSSAGRIENVLRLPLVAASPQAQKAVEDALAQLAV